MPRFVAGVVNSSFPRKGTKSSVNHSPRACATEVPTSFPFSSKSLIGKLAGGRQESLSRFKKIEEEEIRRFSSKPLWRSYCSSVNSAGVSSSAAGVASSSPISAGCSIMTNFIRTMLPSSSMIGSSEAASNSKSPSSKWSIA